MTTIKTPAQLRTEQRKKGFTLTEIAIVLGIIGLILGAIWVAAAGVYTNQRTTHANTDVMQIAQSVRTLFATSSTTGYSTAADITPTLASAGTLPNDLNCSTAANGLCSGPYPGGNTQVTATKDGLGFIIAMGNMNTAQCIALTTVVGGTSRDSGLYEAAADSTAIAGGTAAVSPVSSAAIANPLTGAVTPSAANQAVGTVLAGVGGCNKAATGLTTYFGFSLK